MEGQRNPGVSTFPNFPDPHTVALQELLLNVS